MQNRQADQQEDYSVWFSEAFRVLGITPSEAARTIGVANAKMYNITKGKFKPGFDTIQQLLQAYPALNANWLLKGQKPILHSSGAEIIGSGYLSAPLTLPLMEPTSDYKNSLATYEVRVSEPRDYKDAVVVRVTDNSMAPRYTVGMRLLVRPVPIEDWDYLNSCLVLVLYRNVLVLRRIKENELLNLHYLTLYADSPDAGHVHVKHEDLRSIWKVFDIIGAGNEL